MQDTNIGSRKTEGFSARTLAEQSSDGHPFGDKVIRAVAQILKANVKAEPGCRQQSVPAILSTETAREAAVLSSMRGENAHQDGQ